MALGSVAKHAYRALLDSQWENGGKIPNQPKIFWKYADMESPEQWDAVAADVLQFFPAIEDGKFIANPKLAQEWDETQARMRLYSIGGQRSAEAKKRNKIASTLQAPCSTPATEAQHKDIDLNIQTPSPDAGASAVSQLRGVVKTVFDYYLAKTGRNPKQYEFTDKRRDKGVSRLREFQKQCDGDIEKAAVMMRRAVDGICADPWDDRVKFREWDKHLFGSQEYAEKWRNAPLTKFSGKLTARPVIDNSAADRELARQLGGA